MCRFGYLEPGLDGGQTLEKSDGRSLTNDEHKHWYALPVNLLTRLNQEYAHESPIETDAEHLVAGNEELVITNKAYGLTVYRWTRSNEIHGVKYCEQAHY